jgi:phospholipid/cholesterol/gamma-HCH transport system ATP-binding protein
MPLERVVPAVEADAPEVVLDDITTILHDSAVLHRLRLVIPAGQLTVLMGPSGAGKTTMIKHIVGLLEPSGGTVRIDGRDIWDLGKEDMRTVRRGIGAMLGGHNLYNTSIFSSYTALDNLIVTLEGQGVPEGERQERAMARLREMRLEDMADRKPDAMPAHARKRLALARALVTDSPLTVLDEIDVGLDHAHSVAMVDGLRRLRERTACTLLITTHTLDLAREIADNLAILVNGRIVAFGPPEEVLDGIETTDDFDRKFEFSDYQGPPKLADAEADADRRPRAQPDREHKISFDPQLVIIAVVAIVLITAVILGLQMFSPGSLP